MNDFLLIYYKQLNFNSMPAEIRAQYDAYSKNDDFRGNMGDWKKTLINVDGSRKDLPDPEQDPNKLEDPEWEKLFRAFQAAFRSMDAARNSFKDNKKANDFLGEYFGYDPKTNASKLFTLAKANDVAKLKIEELKKLLETHKRTMSIKLKEWGLLDNDFSFNDLVDGLKDEKYNTDGKFQTKLKEVAKYISYHSNNDANLTKEIQSQDFDNIENGFDSSGSVEPGRLDYFKRNYNSMLHNLYTDSKVREVFVAHDNGKISKPLVEALEKTNYGNKESKDYIPPKRTDEMTLVQQISNLWGETYEDYLEKYTTLRGDRLFFSSNAKFIVKAIDSSKIKPTDGLDKILTEAENIKKNLLYKSPKASEAFEYFVTIITELKATMPKAFAGALHNSRMLRAIIEEIVINAVKNGKVEQAKVAMEVLSVIKYGYTTSKIMDTIGKEKMTIFSDPSLSWNKNDGIKFVTAAVDKSFKTAFMGVGYGITIVGNAINLSGTKFNGKADPKRIGNSRNIWSIQNKADKDFKESQREKSTNQLNITNVNLQNMNQGPDAINEQNIQQHETQLTDNRKKADLIEQNINDLQKLIDYISDLQDEETQLQDLIKNPANVNITQVQAQLARVHAQLNLYLPNLQQYKQDIQTATNDLNQLKQSIDQNNDRITQFHNATSDVKFLSDQIKKNDDDLATWDSKNKDQYLELMAHWDFLETGSNVKSWALGSKKAKQAALDKTQDIRDPATGQIQIDPATGQPVIDKLTGKTQQQKISDWLLKKHYHEYAA